MLLRSPCRALSRKLVSLPGFPVVFIAGSGGASQLLWICRARERQCCRQGQGCFLWDFAAAQAPFPIRASGLLEMCDVDSVKWASHSWKS